MAELPLTQQILLLEVHIAILKKHGRPATATYGENFDISHADGDL